MYKLLIWDKQLAADGHAGAIAELEVPTDLAKLFFKLDSLAFPLLSSLSFDDYDLFSGDELPVLIAEIRDIHQNALEFSENIDAMIGAIIEAQSQGKAVLFDPFQ